MLSIIHLVTFLLCYPGGISSAASQLLLTSNQGSQTNSSSSPNYAVVIDAASSKTAVWVYTWMTSMSPSFLPVITPAFTGSVPTRLASFSSATPPINIATLLQPIIALVRPQVPTAAQAQTSIYFYGTSGKI